MTPRFIPGAVYESKTHGLVEFKGIDRYMGQASLRFYSVDHDQTCYWLPTALGFHFGTAQETPVAHCCHEWKVISGTLSTAGYHYVDRCTKCGEQRERNAPLEIGDTTFLEQG
jgi:hypothetical protein